MAATYKTTGTPATGGVWREEGKAWAREPYRDMLEVARWETVWAIDRRNADPGEYRVVITDDDTGKVLADVSRTITETVRVQP